MSTPETSPILTSRDGAITRITLNRPRAINALNAEMFAALATALREANADGSSSILLDGAGERGFCGGGDVKAMSADGGAAATAILRAEYRVDHTIAVSAVPVVAIMDGVAMGGGIGLGGHAAHRVVTERSRLAMPEARIGIAPDVGGHLLLSRAPGRLGELLAVTAGTMGPGDAIALGFADHFVPSERLEALGVALAAGEDPASALSAVAEVAPDAPLLAARAWWDPIADAALAGMDAERDPAAAALGLLRELEASPGSDSLETLGTVREMCPVSVAITLAQLARTRRGSLGLAEVLDDDLRVVSRLAARPDFAEGVRAQLVDRDRNPRWDPSRIEDLDSGELAEILAPRRREEPTLDLGAQ